MLDLAMPGATALNLQQALADRGSGLPIIFLTAHGDIPMSVRAMKSGAMDFLVKPCGDEELLAAIKQALVRDRELRAGRMQKWRPRAAHSDANAARIRSDARRDHRAVEQTNRRRIWGQWRRQSKSTVRG